MTTLDASAAGAPPVVEIYHKAWCPYCRAALALLDKKGVAYRIIEVSGDRERAREMTERSGRHTVPQIFIDGASLGGFDDIVWLDREGRLDALLRRGAA